MNRRQFQIVTADVLTAGTPGCSFDRMSLVAPNQTLNGRRRVMMDKSENLNTSVDRGSVAAAWIVAAAALFCLFAFSSVRQADFSRLDWITSEQVRCVAGEICPNRREILHDSAADLFSEGTIVAEMWDYD